MAADGIVAGCADLVDSVAALGDVRLLADHATAAVGFRDAHQLG